MKLQGVKATLLVFKILWKIQKSYNYNKAALAPCNLKQNNEKLYRKLSENR